MKKIGLENVEILKYKADGKTRYADYIIPQAWDAKKAELKIITPKDSAKLLASYKRIPQSLFMYSAPTPEEGIASEVILLEDGSREKDYQGKNIIGKVVFTSGDAQSIWRLAQKHGAMGIIADWANAYPHQEGIHWANYCFVPKNDKKMFGFSISKKDGKYLRRLIKTNENVEVSVKVNTKLYNDKAETITGIIPGKNKKEEILVFSHLYEIGAWDNASGSACIIEIARVLNSLIRKNILPEPKRNIRFMLGWECYSLIGYLTRDKRVETIAGLNLDGVGIDPARWDVPIISIHGMPDANPSYTDLLLEEIAKSYLSAKTNLEQVRIYPFGGCDSLPSDPLFNIPFPILYQHCTQHIWHTSKDTPDILTASISKWNAVVAATYLYFLANAGYKEAFWLAEKVSAKYKKKLTSIEEKKHFYYQRDRGIQTLNSIMKLVSNKERRKINTQTTIEEECLGKIQNKIRGKRKEKSKKTSYLQKKASQMIPKRLVPGILTLETLPEKVKNGCKWGPGYQVLVKPILWTNGKRSLLEIATLLHLETNRKPDLKNLIECYEFLEKYGYIRIRRKRE